MTVEEIARRALVYATLWEAEGRNRKRAQALAIEQVAEEVADAGLALLPSKKATHTA